MFLSHRYIEEENERNLLNYKYVGIDRSFLYHRFFSPIAKFFVNRTPEWIAPNLITLTGFLCVLLPHLMVYYFFPSLTRDIPSFWRIAIGVLHFFYMNLDNMDGMQARKTKNSSPLGLLFDHGCDALIVTLQSVNLAAVFQLGPSYKSFSIFVMGSFTFFFTNLEEYYTNEMELPEINGPTEGCLLVGIFFIFSGLTGSQFWEDPLGLLDISKKDFVLYSFVLFTIINLSFNFFQIWKKAGVASLKAASTKGFFLIYMVLSVLMVSLLSPELWRKEARVLIYILGIHFGKLVVMNLFGN